jgi:predicted MFS family arabinose efflux permease
LASISLIQEIAPPDRVNTMISILILVKLLPNVVFMHLGGVLADTYDRRKIQVVVDATSSVCVLVYMVAIQYRSIPILYAATFCQECLSGLYLPSNSSILPLLTSSGSELKKATTLSGLTWSLMTAIGSAAGGVLVAVFGVKGCFVIDSMTYLVSASLLAFGVRGNFVATEEEKQRRRSSLLVLASGFVPAADDEQPPFQRRRSSLFAIHCPTSAVNWTDDLFSVEFEADLFSAGEEAQPVTSPKEAAAVNGTTVPTQSQLPMFLEGFRFAFWVSPTVGAYVLLKGAAALTFGASDVLNVAFSDRGSEGDAQQTSLKLGLLFCCLGVGSILGSTLCDVFASFSRPNRTVRLCLVGYLLIATGCLAMGSLPHRFAAICLSSIVRSTGSSLLWICSTLLLQKYTPPPILGRVQSIDLSAALLGEALSALGAGFLMDGVGLTPEGLSVLLAASALGLFVVWNVVLFLILSPPPPAKSQRQRVKG